MHHCDTVSGIVRCPLISGVVEWTNEAFETDKSVNSEVTFRAKLL